MPNQKNNIQIKKKGKKDSSVKNDEKNSLSELVSMKEDNFFPSNV